MSRSSALSSLWLPFAVLVCVLFASPAAAFGAGNIPSYAYLEGKAFRHGDIEDILEELARGGGGAAGLLGAMTGGLLAKKFGGLDIKRVYFGNWLRDYSQAMDVAGLSKLSVQAIINLIMALGFLAHGYATGEFEVTEERLGVYLPTEHIDNPKDYNDNKDARTVHPKLRPPVDPQELECDPETGMLNYIANEKGHWDTSKALVRRVLLQCIDMGRKARSGGGNDAQYEAYRLLGTALHTLEDFPAHSNYCELVLIKLGYNQVFPHVGDNVRIRAPNGHMCPPLVTGTFGGSDFIHSLLGEATDHISSASVSDLNKAMDKAISEPGDRGIDSLRDMMFQLPGGEGQQLSRDMDNVNNIRANGKNPMDMSPQELHAVLWQVLTFRDNVSKAIERTIEKIPGLNSLVEKLGNSINRFVFVTLEPYLKPIMKQATGALTQGSAAVVNNQDQFRVWNDPNYAHPTHSMLAKDHFNGILNEPAGNVAKIIVRHTVTDVVKAWDDTSINAHQVVENILHVLYHPFFNIGHPIQHEMENYVRSWIDSEDKGYTLNALNRDSVKNHKNHRKGHPNEGPPSGPGGYTSFLPTPAKLQHQASGFIQQQVHHLPGYSQYQQASNQFHQVFPGREINAGYDAGPPPSQSPYSGGQGYGDPQAYNQRVNEAPYPGQSSYAPPPPVPQGGYGGYDNPPPPQDMYGGPPAGGSGWGDPRMSSQQPHYQDPNAYPGQQYQQHHQGSGWSGQAPPPGRW